MVKKLTPLKKRIIEISQKYQLAHVGSNLSAVSIIDSIYKQRKQNEPFILSSGHAGIALYVVLEKYYGIDAEYLFKKHGIHAVRDIDNQIWCTTGSLGHGLPIALGMALEDRNNNVYCLTSDGEWMEGSMWEALRLAQNLKVENLKIYVNANSWGGMEFIEPLQLRKQIKSFGFPVKFILTNTLPLHGLEAHYQRI